MYERNASNIEELAQKQNEVICNDIACTRKAEN